MRLAPESAVSLAPSDDSGSRPALLKLTENWA